MMMPVLFLSHGAPALPEEAGETGAAWRELGERLPRPTSILMVSAHWESGIPTLSLAAHPATIHDFSGFPEALYRVRYPAPGAPGLAERAARLLQEAGVEARLDAGRGLDHGAWMPLSIIFPAADIPVTQLALQPHRDPAWHLALGRALRPLREEGVLIIGSGSITHNLRAVFRHPAGTAAPDWVTGFRDWVADRISVADIEALCAYRVRAPHAEENHPTDEHLLPLFVVLGAAAGWEAVQHLNPVMTFGMLGMDAWLFEGQG
jgi:4,5-DOPA dioxygenase extradiol